MQEGGKLYFHFKDARDPHNIITFDQELPSYQCKGNNKHGQRCKRRVIIGLPYCFQHLQSITHLKIQDSTLEGAGKGLFAWRPGAQGNVFNANQWIIPYSGEQMTRAQLDARYGQTATAPYGMEISRNHFLDAATHRSVASLINHEHEYHANCKFQKNPRDQKVWVRCTDPIEHGDELFVDYGASYQHDVPNVHHSTDNRKYGRLPDHVPPPPRRGTKTSRSRR